MENEMRMSLATRGRSARAFTPAGTLLQPDEQVVLIQASLDARRALEAAIAASTEALQRARSVSAELDARLADSVAVQPEEVPAPAGLDALSPREKEVLMLVAAGHTNKAIADALYLSPNTIKTHVSSLLTKLRAETRVQLAVIAAQLRLAPTG